MEGAKVRAIIKRPDESFGHMCNISIRLENLQKLVGGYIETIPVKDFQNCVILCNEDGKMQGLPVNIRIPGDFIVGTIVVLGVDGDEFAAVPIEFSAWKEYIKRLQSAKTESEKEQ
jgi:hypothetical protein